MELGLRLIRISALAVLAAVPVFALVAFAADAWQVDSTESDSVGFTENLTSDVLVIDGPASAPPSGPSREAIADGAPVETLLRDWQYTIRKPSRFH